MLERAREHTDETPSIEYHVSVQKQHLGENTCISFEITIKIGDFHEDAGTTKNKMRSGIQSSFLISLLVGLT